jgi:phytol kinase
MGSAVVLVVAGAAFVAMLASAEAAGRRWKVEPELSRKLVHVSSGVVAAGLPLVMPFRSIAALALLFVPFMVVSRRLDLFPAVHSVERSTLGEVWFPLGVAAVAVLVPHPVPYAYGMLVMGVSDAAAGLAGGRWGHRAFRVATARKTYVGSGAFLASTLSLTVAATVLTTGGLSAANLWSAVVVSAALALAEAAVGGGADNVVLPTLAAALLTML